MQFFENITNIRILLKYQLLNYKIKLLLEIILSFEIFRLIKKEKFKKLKKYLKKNLAKGFVRKLILSIKHVVFFILKK